MDAYQQQQRYMRPPQPPPSTSDPYQHYQQHQQRPPVPQQGTWYSNQFQYQPPPPSHSPSPPPPHHWPPPPPASAYPPPPPPSHPYPPHLPPQNHHFPPRPHAPPPPPPPQQQSYAQDWGNPNWGQQQQHQAWDYSAAHNNAEDWAAKARAWAAAKQVAAEDQHPPPQFSRPEEQQSHYYNQYHPQTVDHYQDVQQQQAFPASGYQQFPTAASAPPPPPPHQASMVYAQESAQSSYTPEGQASTAGSFVHQQEVPSSYSSVTGKAETANQHEQLNKPLPLPIPQSQEVQLHLQPPLPTTAKSVLAEGPFAYGNHAADPTPDLSDQPLQFATGFSHNHDPHMQSSFTGHHDSTGPSTSVPSVNSWTPAVTSGAVYPQMSSVLSSGPQHDPSVAVPSPVSGHASLAFGSFPGSNFPPAIPPTGMPYGLGAGPALPSAAGFPGDTYGVSNVSERPKKASVPNWLKEEIIKKASVMTRPALEHSQKETQSFEDEGVDKSFGKSDLTDGKSIDSSRSTEEDEDDEDSAEAARSAAINQEIKRILTEVLLKVTDELFDEIATKVLDEDNLTVEGEHNTMPSNHEVSPSPPGVPAPKASAKVLIPVKANESETEESSSGSPGNVLGLVNYASDEDDEIQSNNMSNSRKSSELQQSSTMKLSEGMHGAPENGISQLEPGERGKEANLEFGVRKTSSVGSNNNLNASMSELSDRENSSKLLPESKDVNSSVDGSKRLGGKNGSQLKVTPEDTMMESEPLSENFSRKKLVADDSEAREMRTKSSQDSRHESRSHSAKDFVKEAESRTGADEKADHHHHRHEERHQRKEKKDDRNGSKDKKNERPGGAGDKGRESESQKRTSRLDSKKDRKEAEDSHRKNAKEDTDRKRERAKDKDEDRARHKLSSDSSKHKRRRSSSISSDETSHDSKRKQHSRKRHSSPSPVRSRRRQVSRSPHSKHSERRHSPYSSLESNRGRRSRSKSPVRRRR